MLLHIKNMVCNRCKWVVKNELEKLGHNVMVMRLGEVELKEEASPQQVEQIEKKLVEFGFELISDRSSQLIETMKTTLISLVQEPDKLEKINLSDYLSSSLHRDYSSLSKLFSEVEGITIEQFFILQKIERAKELLVYDEMSLTQIAYDLGYSSVAHLSSQFKKVTGLTPSHFKQLRGDKRKPLDGVNGE
jgi:AraC-like DNA-binding protein